jgi:hypothetical protein
MQQPASMPLQGLVASWLPLVSASPLGVAALLLLPLLSLPSLLSPSLLLLLLPARPRSMGMAMAKLSCCMVGRCSLSNILFDRLTIAMSTPNP